MDQKSSLQEEDKRLINYQNQEPFSDEQIDEILELINVFADIIYQSMTQNS